MEALRQSFGLEEITREAFVIVFQNLNNAIAEEETYWNTYDQELNTLRGIPPNVVSVERVPSANFHLGHQPSLVQSENPDEDYPAVSVMAYRSQPAEYDTTFDHGSEYNDSLYIEFLVKATSDEGAEVCNKRVWRTANAINKVILNSRNLNGAVSDIGISPTCIISETFTWQSEGDYGDDHSPVLWQAGRIDYELQKVSPFDY